MYWITGKEGLLGKAICRHFKAENIPFIGTSRLEVDILDPKPTFEFDTIINCAAYTAVDKAEDEIALAHAINVRGVQSLARLGKKVIHFSTEHVFDGKSNAPYKETDATAPLSIYGKTKREGEERLLELAPDALILRVAWLFGKDGGSFLKAMKHLMQERETVTVVEDQWGCPTCIEDIAKVLPLITQKKGICHLVNEGAVSRYEFAKAIASHLNFSGLKPTTSKAFQAKAHRPAYGVLSTEKAMRWGVSLRPWQEALKDTLINS